MTWNDVEQKIEEQAEALIKIDRVPCRVELGRREHFLLTEHFTTAKYPNARVLNILCQSGTLVVLASPEETLCEVS